MNFKRVGARREEPMIDMMPLIDVVFLLLIFFMITSSVSQTRESEIPVNLPTGVSGQDTGKGERVVLVVDEDGNIVFEGNIEVPEGSLDERLEHIKVNNPDASIMLRGDSGASHGRVVEILDTIKVKGFKKVNLVIEKR